MAAPVQGPAVLDGVRYRFRDHRLEFRHLLFAQLAAHQRESRGRAFLPLPALPVVDYPYQYLHHRFELFCQTGDSFFHMVLPPSLYGADRAHPEDRLSARRKGQTGRELGGSYDSVAVPGRPFRVCALGPVDGARTPQGRLSKGALRQPGGGRFG